MSDTYLYLYTMTLSGCPQGVPVHSFRMDAAHQYTDKN